MIRYLFFLLILIAGHLKAQVTLNEVDFPNAGDTIRYSKISTISGDYTTSGSALLWDFSGLVPDSQYVKKYNPITTNALLVYSTFGAFAPTKYRASYANENKDLPLDQLSQFLPVAISEINSYTRSIADSITALGYSITTSGQVIPFKSDTIETKYKFPLSYGSFYNSKGYTYVDLNPIADFKFKQYRKRTSQVDANGTLITPFGSFDVLRVKHDIEEIDSVYQTFLGTGFWFGLPKSSTTEYEWFTSGKKDVLLKIVVLNSNGISQIQSVEYQDIYRNLSSSLTELKNNVLVYPTVVDDRLTIVSQEKLVQFEMVDLHGNIVLQEIVNEPINTINTNKLNRGVYFLRLYSSNDSASFRIIKQ